MGAVKVDTEKQARAYEVKYALNDAAGIKALLRDRHRIAERRYKGDTAASDIIIDLHSAINSAGLTERQTESIAWVYGRDLTQARAAEIMGIAQKNVSELIDAAAAKLANVFARWEYGDVTVEFDYEMEAV
jgi:DNA-directed RNA polymerase specialized sigma subunit